MFSGTARPVTFRAASSRSSPSHERLPPAPNCSSWMRCPSVSDRKVVTRMFQLVRGAAEQGSAVLLVEQYATRALEIAQRAHVLQRGSVALQGRASDLLTDVET